MMRSDQVQDRMLLVRLRWFVRLRWLAGLTVIAGALADHWVMHWYPKNAGVLIVGLAILIYNLMFRLLLGRKVFGQWRGMVLSWSQIILDLSALSLLTMWTGGATSPLMGFFVFHMVFASLLLPRHTAYGGAAISVIMVTTCLWFSGQIPPTEGVEMYPRLVMAGWILTLALTVYLANSIMRSLRRHRTRLLSQNHRVRAMAKTLRLQQQTMIQHEKMVAMGQMAAGVAHEIANPLANIDSMLQLAERHPDRMTGDKLTTLRQQAARIRQILSQLTNFAHPTDMHWEMMPIIDLVETGLAMVRFDRRHRAVLIERDFSPAPCLLHIQPHAMQQVLINLLLNAIDAVGSAANPKLIVRTRCVGSECHISITDNGTGIPPEHKDHIFEPFFTTKPVGKGTGLGLAISYSLVNKQGGRIEVDSAPGRGTTMTVILPKPTPAATVNQLTISAKPSVP